MRKMDRQLKKTESNKGFTLVELVIVIAILAVLAAIMVPQYVKYIERSRQTVDSNAVNEIAHAAEIAYMGDGTNLATNTSFQLKIPDDGKITDEYIDLGDNLSDKLGASVQNIIASNSYVYKSDLYRGKTITFVIDDCRCTWSSVKDADTAPSSKNPTSY